MSTLARSAFGNSSAAAIRELVRAGLHGPLRNPRQRRGHFHRRSPLMVTDLDSRSHVAATRHDFNS